MPPRCYNCNRPAMYLVGPPGQQVALCLDCQLKQAQLSAMQADQLEREMNFAASQMEAVLGTPGTMPRYPERQIRIIKGGPVTNINVTNSSIGVLNTGNLEIVDSAITILNGSQETKSIADALSRLTNAITASDNLSVDKKNEALETLSVVAAEATASKEKRKGSVVKQLLHHIPSIIETSAAAMEIWEKVGPSILSFFN